jgi:type IV pilus assembly protein PilE
MRIHSKHSRTIAKGFTLIELMITVAVVAILGSIAMASYTNQIQKSRRTDARSAVMDLAGREEKLFSTVNAYSGTASDLGYGGGAFPITIGSGYYSVNIAVPNPPISFVVTATAIGSQAGDTKCATLSVDQLGSQTSTGTETAATCWGN